MCARPKTCSADRALCARQRIRRFSTVLGPPSAAGTEVVQLDLPGAAAALAVRAAPGAATLVPLPHLAPHRCRDGLPSAAGLLRRLRRERALPLPRRLGGAPALAVLLERALDRLAEDRRQVTVRELVGEERLQLVEVLLRARRRPSRTANSCRRSPAGGCAREGGGAGLEARPAVAGAGATDSRGLDGSVDRPASRAAAASSTAPAVAARPSAPCAAGA